MRFPPLAPVAHKDDLPEDSQMFRDRGLRDADAIDHRVDGLLPSRPSFSWIERPVGPPRLQKIRSVLGRMPKP